MRAPRSSAAAVTRCGAGKVSTFACCAALSIALVLLADANCAGRRRRRDGSARLAATAATRFAHARPFDLADTQLIDTRYNYSQLIVAPPDLISRALVRDGEWERGLNRQLVAADDDEAATADRPRREQLVVDLGANVGSFTLFALARGHRVLSFEMQPRLFTLCALSVRLNGWSARWRGFNVALSDVDGAEVSFTPFRGNVGRTALRDDERGAERARARRLDALLRGVESIFFLKVDIEGAEWRVVPTLLPWFARGAIAHAVFEFQPGRRSLALARFLYDRASMRCSQGELQNGLEPRARNVTMSRDEALAFVANVRASAQGRVRGSADLHCVTTMITRR